MGEKRSLLEGNRDKERVVTRARGLRVEKKRVGHGRKEVRREKGVE